MGLNRGQAGFVRISPGKVPVRAASLVPIVLSINDGCSRKTDKTAARPRDHTGAVIIRRICALLPSLKLGKTGLCRLLFRRAPLSGS